MTYLLLASFLANGQCISNWTDVFCGTIPLLCENKLKNDVIHNFAKLINKASKIHNLEPGQTVGQLARMYNLSEEQILEANPGLSERVSRLQIGEGINIPESAIEFSSNLKHKSVDQQIQEAASWSKVDPRVLSAMLKIESGMNPAARSQVGAQGLGQLMPIVQKMFGVSDPNDTAQNIAASAMYLAGLLRSSPGDTPELKYWHALMQYNWGPGNFRKWVNEGGRAENVPAETRSHTRKVYDELGWSIPRAYISWYQPEKSVGEVGVSKPSR